ncbi:MAG: glycosyltransferase family 4 protein [Desulfohalobiaceae bacterium]|nr:glycosyltransferase family 4 protein [Desulfohalobiaceae bacterium]
MHILHINLEPGWRGGERQTLNLMLGLRDLGYANHLLTRKMSPLSQKVREQGFPATEISKPYLAHGYFLRKFDCIQTHEVRGLQLAAAWKPLLGRPLVYTRRVDFTPSRRWFTVKKYRQADKVIAISQKIRSVLVEWGLEDDQCCVIPSGISFETRPQQKRIAMLRTRFAGQTVIGSITSLVDHKDPFTLLQTAAWFERNRRQTCFVLVGDGPLRPDIERRIKELQLSNIHLEGYQEDPYSYLAVFDCFVISSKQEGLCTSILDAFQHGIPVVATAAGGIPELVLDRETGLLAPVGRPDSLAAAITTMLDDAGLQEACTRRAKHWVAEQFGLQSMARSYARVYEELVPQ